VAANADIQVGDTLSTSGLDGIYPPGLPVAQVVSVDRRVESGFARILLAPTARPDGVRHVLVLEPLSVQLPPRPEPAAAAPVAKSPAKGASR
jgi:rod shape-determining protein MreC